jgi:hypothetical protein
MAAALKLAALALIVGCSARPPDPVVFAENLEPSVPPQCYAKTGDRNPCYVCHTAGIGPNTLDDADLQADYAFSEYARENHWTNLFADRRAAIARTPADEILAYVREDNWTPVRDLDLRGGFDADGFANDGSGWRAVRYLPFPGYWPASGSTGDLYVRLPAELRTTRAEALANLARLAADPTVYPVGTELLHTVRYLDPDAPGLMARRLKEVRWMRKEEGPDAADRLRAYEEEANEKDENVRPHWRGDAAEGMVNAFGWRLQAWIEDADGRLRLQSDEEHRACMGCHQSVGVTMDSTFAFPRIVGWGPQDVRGLVDPQAAIWLERTGTPLDPPVSRDQALALDVAYREIVKEQSFVLGRDAVVAPSTQVWRRIDDSVTGAAAHTYRDVAEK